MDAFPILKSSISLEVLLEYYTLDYLMSDQARKKFVEPDLKALPSIA